MSTFQMNSSNPSPIQACQGTFTNPQEHNLRWLRDQVPASSSITTAGKKSQIISIREKVEYHACWKVLEAVVWEQGEWGGFNAATQQCSFFLYFPTVPQKARFVQSHTQLKLRPRLQVIRKCSNLFSLYFSVMHLKFHSTESCTIDNTAVLIHEWIAQEIHFIHIFALPLLRWSLFAQPSGCSALCTPLLGVQCSFAPWMPLPALFKALHVPRAVLSSSCYHLELLSWYSSIKYTHKIFLQWKHKTVFYWVFSPSHCWRKVQKTMAKYKHQELVASFNFESWDEEK